MLKQKIKELFANDCSGHDYWHSIRVLNIAEKISKTEKCNNYIIMIAALLHDTDDIKIFETKDYENARCIMSECHLTEDTIDNVIEIIKEISFKGTETTSPKSIEGKIVQDADRLDAMGGLLNLKITYTYSLLIHCLQIPRRSQNTQKRSFCI